MNVRNALGVRHQFFNKQGELPSGQTAGQRDWIFDLNIGNVMHLSLMNAEELNDSTEGRLEQTTHELGKDSMLEKIVLVSVAYFCIATEMRFIMTKKLATEGESCTKADSEAFHAQALQISSLFLPA